MIRKPASFMTSICDERGQELLYAGIPITDVSTNPTKCPCVRIFIIVIFYNLSVIYLFLFSVWWNTVIVSWQLFWWSHFSDMFTWIIVLYLLWWTVLCRLNCILYFYFKVYSFVADVLTDWYRLRASLVQAAQDYMLTQLFVFNTISIVDLYK